MNGGAVPAKKRSKHPSGEVAVTGLPEWIDVAVIIAPHGVRGEVKVRLLTDFPARFTERQDVRLLGPGAEVREVAVWLNSYRGERGIMQIDGLTDRTGAEKLRGWRVQIPRRRCPPLPAGQYYVFELVGMQVYSEDGEHLGEIEDVLRLPANDVYVVRQSRGRTFLLPALRSVVREVDVPGRRLMVDLPPGLLD